jgi:hypothetical protein
LGAIVNTMYNWSDNLQTSVPGYRDRVAHIHHTEKEGGLNLNMKEETIDALSKRGACAGEMLRARFTGQDKTSALSMRHAPLNAVPNHNVAARKVAVRSAT